MQTVIVYAELHCFWRNLMLFCIEILKRGDSFPQQYKKMTAFPKPLLE